MKAYVLKGINQLEYTDINLPELKPDEAMIRIKAAGICSSDIPRIYKNGTYHFPLIPGHEFAGIVEKTASHYNESWIGKKVAVFPLIPCFRCDQCKQKMYEMCDNYNYLGSRKDGGFAEYVSVPIWNLLEIPDNVSYTEAAMMEPLSVALHATKRLEIKESDTVGIVGTGMIGFAAAQWANIMKPEKVSIIARNNKKSDISQKLNKVEYKIIGKDNIGTYNKVIEAVGTPEAISLAVSITKPGGKIVLLGNPSGEIPLHQDTYWRILRKQITLTGTWNSSFDKSGKCDWKRVCEALSSKEINASALISHIFKKEQLPQGLRIMKEHKETYCKVMTDWS